MASGGDAMAEGVLEPKLSGTSLFSWFPPITGSVAGTDLLLVRRDAAVDTEHTVVDWFNYMREECTRKLLTLNIRLGGPGRIAEIDESVMIKGKYNRGARRQQHQQWLF
eukprot:gene16379-18018_t